MLTSNQNLESMVALIARELPRVNIGIIYVMVLNQLADLACRAWVKVSDNKGRWVYPNCYAMVFSRSGGGKDRTREAISDAYFTDAERLYNCTKRERHKALKEELKAKALEKYPESSPVDHLKRDRFAYIQQNAVRELKNTIVGGTPEGFVADRMAIKKYGFGATSCVIKEFGDSLGSGERSDRRLLSLIKDVWDKGDNDDKTIKGDAGDKTVKDVPCNFMGYTTLSHVLKDSKKRHELQQMLVSGWGRRILSVYDKSVPDDIALDYEQALRMVEEEVGRSSELKAWGKYLHSLAGVHFSNRDGVFVTSTFTYTKEAEARFRVYEASCQNKSNNLQKARGKETVESVLLEGVAWQAFRIAGLLAFLDNATGSSCGVVSVQNFEDATKICDNFLPHTVEVARDLEGADLKAGNVYVEIIHNMIAGEEYNQLQLKTLIGDRVRNLRGKWNLVLEELEENANSLGFMFCQRAGKKREILYYVEPKVHSETVPVAISISDDKTEGYEWYEKDVVVDLKTAIKMATECNYSPSQFKNGYRKAENWLGGNTMLVFDVDDGTTLEQAESMFFDTACALLPTRNHQVAKDGQPPRDRFRVFLPLLEPINFTDAERFKRVMRNVAKSFKLTFDKATVDPSRFYFPSPPEALDKVWYSSHNGNYVDWRDFDHEEMGRMETAIVTRKHNSTYSPRLGDDKEFVKRCLEKFMDTHFREGNRNNALFRACSWLKDAGFSEVEASAVLESKMNSNPLPRDEERRTIRQVFKR